jgi:hypothetical protein
MPDDAPKETPFPFLRLPLELREQIYSIYFKPADHLVRSVELEASGFFGGVYQWDFALWLTNKQIYAEAKKVWRRENIFVKVATPWPSAGMYRVYLMATDGVAEQLEYAGRRGRRELFPRLGLHLEDESLIYQCSSLGQPYFVRGPCSHCLYGCARGCV